MANASGILGTLYILIKSKGDTSGLKKTERALQGTERSLKRTSKSLSAFHKLSKGVFLFSAFHGAKNIFNSYLQFEKELGSIKSRFYAITKSDLLAEEELNWISKLAIKTANDVKTVADSYSIFYASTQRALGKEGARGIFEQWTNISRVLHLSEEQFGRVTYALREMSSKGQLYSQDLKIQLGTHVPDAINMAEEAITRLGIKGVSTIEEFQKLTKKDPKGGWMPKFLKEFSNVASSRYSSPEALRKAMQQPDALSQMIKNMGGIFTYEFSKAGGQETLIALLQGIYKTIESLPYKQIAKALGYMSKILDFVGTYLPQIANLLLMGLIGKVGIGFSRGVTKFLVGKKVSDNKMIKYIISQILTHIGLNKLKLSFTFRRWFLILRQLLARFFLGAVWKTALKAGLSATGVGTIITILWTIVDVLIFIKGVLPQKNKGKTFGNTDIPMEQVASMVEYLNKKPIYKPADVESAFVKAGLGAVTPYIRYDTKDNRTFYIQMPDSAHEYSPSEFITEFKNKTSQYDGDYLNNKPSQEQLRRLLK